MPESIRSCSFYGSEKKKGDRYQESNWCIGYKYHRHAIKRFPETYMFIIVDCIPGCVVDDDLQELWCWSLP
jgi:hypothetical protein